MLSKDSWFPLLWSRILGNLKNIVEINWREMRCDVIHIYIYIRKPNCIVAFHLYLISAVKLLHDICTYQHQGLHIFYDTETVQVIHPRERARAFKLDLFGSGCNVAHQKYTSNVVCIYQQYHNRYTCISECLCD